MSPTQNHQYNVPAKGEENWHVPLNENFEQYDTDIEIRDRDERKVVYEPKDGAKFLATDTERVYVGDGSSWTALRSTGRRPTFDALDLTEDAATFAGTVGVGTDSETDARTRLDVRDGVSGRAHVVGNHVVAIENTSSDGDGNVLALKVNDPSPDSSQNLVTFMDEGTVVGRIEGSGGGVAYASGFGDFAEFFPKADPADQFEPGTVVGLRAGKVVRETTGADAALVVSDRYVVLGNTPPDGEEHAHLPLALTGQVTVRVRGPVDAGDLLVPADAGDGVASAVDPAAWDPLEHPLMVGRALDDVEEGGPEETTVTVAVGLHDLEPVAGRLHTYHNRLTAVETSAERQQRLVDEFARENERLRTTIHEVQDENERLRGRVDALEETVSALVADTEQTGPATNV
jgi:hypothetical protein